MTAREECRLPNGVSIRPDGVHELSPHAFELREIHRNVTVTLLKCPDCGREDLMWRKQEDTESEFFGERLEEDGEFSADPCVFDETHVYRNVTVEVLSCKNCGRISVSWNWQHDTEELDPQSEEQEDTP